MPKGIYEHHPQYRDKNCLDCGILFKPKSPVAKRCDGCRLSKRREWGREATRKSRLNHNYQDKCPVCGGLKMKVAKMCDPCRRKSNTERAATIPTLDSNGYRTLRVDGVEISEHRKIMQDNIKRKLHSYEIVHHLNGIRTDNRIENLVITDKRHHESRTFIKKLQERIRMLEQLHLNLNARTNRESQMTLLEERNEI